ncbi:diaminobutyrate acetyltransferase [Neobacillus mesonae]|uniref:diaminobutyrate acetyltransferase n=1 Tax=Neobacillus mesonae TaxID=1193713 RepID=UPI00203FF36F|nr:diaminobutyrate acetyltransferase [Neobacillus mesonae]MCM3570849.1 diaminobutyrate acetyltransferase [Neobacillus mesonae]
MTLKTYSPNHFRKPKNEDGANIWELIKSTRTLDLNSAYSYLMLCEFFSDTCVVAEEDHELIGFVSAFRPPQQDDTIFVWQVAVHPSHQGKGIGKKLLQELLSRESCENIHYLEATISPSNIASQSLFKGLAKNLNCPYEISECFSEKLFPETGHEAEQTYRIGPFQMEKE